ncbi:uncharacterized protein B0H18DRAFT_402710 [Fomitopsis serialis]|uniref:uncharacterized protein n=1 Tax=Fomitopsis serialis TaxID=139415 RepID=UPI002008DBE4|nr:uncharacterized protein B0H18DRAFT_177629 [Neoantrodia serialis]XP_047892730.1 uncharacterized protein B0H18DRAFT_402710 [Neoantrodia serialis]KAH9913375.1 hypothetical protein B0H18DRAFT_177629 [Neoantrodia serialis]KAH9924801.1 hypothetical protein B0H18DRAFT_402710 [Neoantrodia serialis]
MVRGADEREDLDRMLLSHRRTSSCHPFTPGFSAVVHQRVDDSIDHAALTGESSPRCKKPEVDDQCFPYVESATHIDRDTDCMRLVVLLPSRPRPSVVIPTGPNMFLGRSALLVGQDDHTVNHLPNILPHISSMVTASTLPWCS